MAGYLVFYDSNYAIKHKVQHFKKLNKNLCHDVPYSLKKKKKKRLNQKPDWFIFSSVLRVRNEGHVA